MIVAQCGDGGGAADVSDVLREVALVGVAFGAEPPEAAELSWGALLVQLDDGVSRDELVGVEMIYEGYLLHYRESRVCPGMNASEGALLAGDFYYAHGLRRLIAHGGSDAVLVLARLMGVGAYARSCDASFELGDALWAYTMGALVALRRGAASAEVEQLFDEVDQAIVEDREMEEIVGMTRAAVPRLGLPDAAPLLRVLDGIPIPAEGGS